MKLTTLRAGCLAGFPASGVLLASQVPVSSSSRERSVQHLPESMSYREWKTLLGRARTPEEFHALAQYCWSRANQYRQKQAACETAMRSSASPSPQSYVGLFSYYQFDNWAYQPSYVSSNTPWFFDGVRIQVFPSEKLKIEPWIVNGWQSYGKFNKAPGLGVQILWRPNGSLSILGNQYWGTDTLGNPGRKRFHTDDSIQVKYYDRPDRALDKAAFTFTVDAGCEYGGGVSCRGGSVDAPAQYFLGFMAYNRLWFHKDLFGLTIGGGAITNPGRYFVLLPPINGATAFTGTPYFTANPGDKFKAWDASLTFDYMPSQFITFRWEYNHRAANVPYFSGPGGTTPPGGNIGSPGSFVPGWGPDLRKRENRLTFALLVKL